MCNYAWSSVFGENTNFTCVANKALRWVWSFNWGPLPDNASPHEITSTVASSSSQLRIQEADPQNAGIYRCEGYDEEKLVEARTCNLDVLSNGKMH